MDTTAKCAGEANLSHDMRVLVFGTCSACGGTEAHPRPLPRVRKVNPTPRPVRIPDAIEVMGPNTVAVTLPTGDADHQLYTLRLLDGPGWGI